MHTALQNAAQTSVNASKTCKIRGVAYQHDRQNTGEPNLPSNSTHSSSCHTWCSKEERCGSRWNRVGGGGLPRLQMRDVEGGLRSVGDKNGTAVVIETLRRVGRYEARGLVVAMAGKAWGRHAPCGLLIKATLDEGEGTRAAIWHIFNIPSPLGTFPMTMARTSNHRLAIGIGRWTTLPGPTNNRLCHFFFYNVVESGAHFVLECSMYNFSLETSSHHYLRMCF